MKANTCDASRRDRFLLGAMSDHEERDFIRHLDSCESCRNELEHSAADESHWQEAADLLANRSSFAREIPTEPHQEHGLPHAVKQVLNALAPTDDTKSLGRIGNYEIMGVVGSGAMGVVLKAEDRALDRIVALKVMNPVLASCGTARQRFAREAKAAAAVLHPNVISIHGVSATEALPYLVMPYVKGMSLQKRVKAQGPLPLPEILRIGSQIAAGLSAAHRQGLIHRDIKPSNIMLDEGVDTAVITDFGLARTIDDATMTRTGVITGTPEYMSPEQARGDAVDFKSDVFSLGSVLYTLCTGFAPFRALTPFGVLRRITDDQPRPVREVNSETPAWLCSIIAELHAKAPSERPTAEKANSLLERSLAHVYQPDQIPLPEELTEPQASRSILFSRPLITGGFVLIILSLLMLFAQPMLEVAQNDSGNIPFNLPQSAMTAAPDESRIYRTISLDFPRPDEPHSVEIDITRGFVEVVGHDQPNVVIEVLYPQSSAKSSGDGDLKTQFSPKFDVDVDQKANRIVLDTYNNTYVLNLRVRVPKRGDLSLTTYSDGYLHARNIIGAIHTHSQHCDIHLQDISGSATAFSYNGDVKVDFHRVAADANLDFESYNGSIDLILPADINASTAINAGRGSFESMFDLQPIDEISEPRIALLSDEVKNSYQFAAINGGGIPIRIESEKGLITLRARKAEDAPYTGE